MMVLTYNAKMIFILPSGGIKYHFFLVGQELGKCQGLEQCLVFCDKTVDVDMRADFFLQESRS